MNKSQIVWVCLSLLYSINLVLFIMSHNYITGMLGWFCSIVLGIGYIFMSKEK